MTDELNHDNERLREALRLIAVMAERDRLHDIARLARNALVSATRANPSLRNPEGVTS
jgi:hypothetical protein